MISGIVLAAGESKRMGKPKQLLSFGDTTILEHVVENLLRSKVSEVVLVLGHESGPIRARFEESPIKIALNPRYQEGISTSIICGLGMASPDSRAFLIALGDQPLIRTEIVDRLIAAYENGGKGIAQPVFRGMAGHPVIFDRKYRGEIESLRGDVGGRAILKTHPEDVLQVEVDSSSVIYDIDEWEDYQKQLEQYIASQEQACG